MCVHFTVPDAVVLNATPYSLVDIYRRSEASIASIFSAVYLEEGAVFSW